MYPRPIKNLVALSILTVSFSTAYKLNAMAPSPISAYDQAEYLRANVKSFFPSYRDVSLFCETFSRTHPNEQCRVWQEFNDRLRSNTPFPSVKALARSLKRVRSQLFADTTPQFRKSKFWVDFLTETQREFSQVIGQAAAVDQCLQYAKRIKSAQGTPPKQHRVQHSLRSVDLRSQPGEYRSISCWPIFKAYKPEFERILRRESPLYESTAKLLLHEYYIQFQRILDSCFEQEISPDEYERANQFLYSSVVDCGYSPSCAGPFLTSITMNYAVAWQKVGDVCDSRSNRTDQYYPGFAVDGFSVYSSRNHSHEIFAIPTRTNDTAFITRVDQPIDHSELLKIIEIIRDTMKHDRIFDGNRKGKLAIPKVSLNQIISLEKAMIVVPHLTFSMDERGAQARCIYRGPIPKCGPPIRDPHFFIDGPFIIWFERTDFPFPIFAAYITEDDWKDPKSE